MVILAESGLFCAVISSRIRKSDELEGLAKAGSVIANKKIKKKNTRLVKENFLSFSFCHFVGGILVC